MPDASDAAPSDEQRYRLPRTVLPRRYELTLEPDLGQATFAGTEVITVDVVETTDEIVLNALELSVDHVWVEGAGEHRVDAEMSLDDDDQRLTLRLTEAIAPGEWWIHVAFRGVLNDKLRGFYRSVYTDADGEQQVIATTQMEATDARRAFPCWDEPDFKAVFAVTLVVPDGLLAVSNGAETARVPAGEGRVAVHFADTIPMSTYLVAFVVGPLEATEAVDVDGTPLRVIHQPGLAHLTPFALDVGAFCLRYFRDYYGIAYPGDKVDLIAIPDFAFGAMENLGAITFREAVLLIDPATASQSEVQRVADVVAHELAHMWFGDLVTMRWWNGLWLNEAFATFMEIAAVDAYRPEWKRWIAFSNERAAAFGVDSLASTRPIEYPVHSPQDAEGMFDVLTYQKGASVLRMLEQYLGHDAFRAGIRRYLDRHALANAETTDLWDALEEATGEPVRRIMDSWILQAGFPLVSVEAAGEGKVELRQHCFRFLPGTDDASNATWSVPLILRDGGPDAPRPVLFDQREQVVEVADTDSLVLNAGGHGFYRVRYDDVLLGSLEGRLDQLEPIERALLLEDTWAAVLAGDTEASAFLDLAQAYAGETDRTSWLVLFGALSAIDRILDGDARTRFQHRVCDLTGGLVDRLGWEPGPDDDELVRQLRGTILGLSGGLGANEVLRQQAVAVHDRYLADASSVEPDVAAAAVQLIAAAGTDGGYEVVLERYRAATSPTEEQRYLAALAGFPTTGQAQRTLELALSDGVRTQDAPFLLASLLLNRSVGPQAWDFVKEHWDTISARFPSNITPRILGGITVLSTPELAADVRAFVAAHPLPQARKQIDQHLERLEVNLAFRRREAERLSAALA